MAAAAAATAQFRLPGSTAAVPAALGTAAAAAAALPAEEQIPKPAAASTGRSAAKLTRWAATSPSFSYSTCYTGAAAAATAAAAAAADHSTIICIKTIFQPQLCN